MPTIPTNDEVVERVFRAMTVHKPSLAALLSMGEEDGTGIDCRLLADHIVRNFPWPIGVELCRLFSGGMRAADRRRLDQRLKTIERSMQFLALNHYRVFRFADPAVIASRPTARFPFSADHIFNTLRRAMDRPSLKTSTR